ncbi:mRNA-decapping enzyme subunit 2 [Microbotryomycetes sp. JL221]|nr:mRNA-decapping enzyme subunit 2 [Microbotryomycetes sp. JL221]
MDRVCFQIEQAHWYYEDFVRPAARNPALLPSFGLKAFSLLMFKSCPLLHDLIPSHQQIWTSFMAYKERVPVCGEILISESWDKVILVKGWQKGSTWSFPRGKINKNEPEAACAVREVLEETGYDSSWAFPPRLLQSGVEVDDDELGPHFVELVIRDQKIRLYFIPNVPENTVFETRTRKEISRIEWFRLSDLPTWGKERKTKTTSVDAGNAAKKPKLYMVTPFISHLKAWIEQNKPRGPVKKSRRQHDSVNLVHAPSVSESRLAANPSSAALLVTNGNVPHFSTAAEGTAALNAFFFGLAGAGPTTADQRTLPSQPQLDGLPRTDSPSNRELIYQQDTAMASVENRRASYYQSSASPSTHTVNLLALMNGSHAQRADPSRSGPDPSSRTEHTGEQSEGNDLLQALHNTLNGSNAQIEDRDKQSLIAAPRVPFEAQDFGLVHVPTASERSTSEQAEKKQALLRALAGVVGGPSPETSSVSSTTQPPPKQDLLSIFNGPSRHNESLPRPAQSSGMPQPLSPPAAQSGLQHLSPVSQWTQPASHWPSSDRVTSRTSSHVSSPAAVLSDFASPAMNTATSQKEVNAAKLLNLFNHA